MYLLAIDQIVVVSQLHPVVQMHNFWCRKKQDGDAHDSAKLHTGPRNPIGDVTVGLRSDQTRIYGKEHVHVKLK